MLNLLRALRGLVFILLCSSSSSASGQALWTIFSHKIEVGKYIGHRFRVQSLARAEYVDDSASARIWAKIEKEKGKNYNNFDDIIKSKKSTNEWKMYVVEGKIDSGATYLVFGTLCFYNGRFSFDDMKVEVELQKGKWQKIFHGDFEAQRNALKEGVEGVSLLPNVFFKANVVAGLKPKESDYLLIEGKDVPNFGMNTKVGKFAEVNGIRLYYEVYGDGPPLVVLHGNGGAIDNGSDFYPDLIKKYQVIAVDSRAQGKSTDTDAPLTYDLMASDINALLEKLHLDSVFIWGQSDGAILGLLLAMDYPKKVKKLVAFGSNIQPDSLALFPWMIAGLRQIVQDSKSPKEKKLNQLMLDYPRIPYMNLARIKAPVLVVAGDRDAIRPEHTLKIFQHIPNSQMCIIPGATHAAAWEQKDFFLKMIQNFFDTPFKMPDTKSWYE